MLSRLSLCGNAGLSKCLVKHQPILALTTSAPVATAAQTPAPAPKESGKRDLINYPRRVLQEHAPPTRFALIPDSWFRMFYPKTGVTGPYMFMISFGTYLVSKEIFVVEHNVGHTLSLIFGLYVINYKLGDKIADSYNSAVNEQIQNLDRGQENEKKVITDTIMEFEKEKEAKSVVMEIMKAKREMILFQIEAAYRERLAEAHKKVKSMLDCQVELQNVERRIAQKNLIDFVIRNVMSSITPELEKNAMQSCISSLNILSAKA